MTIAISSVAQLSDDDVLTHVQRAAQHERHATAQLIALLMELDTRRLYLGEGCSSLFTYSTQVLRLSEHAAYGRIEAARAARRFPVILQRLAEGTINLTAIGLLSPHLTPENHMTVLEAASHKSKREIEQLVAGLHPRADVPTVIRKLPEASRLAVADAGSNPAMHQDQDPPLRAPSFAEPAIAIPTPVIRPAEVTPLATERYKIQFIVGRDTYEKLRRIQDLLRHSIPNGDPAAIFDRALTVLLEDISKRKLAAASHPRRDRDTPSLSRHIPAAVRRAVWTRDEGQCAFRGTQGRCGETGLLEFHHVIPFAAGGETTAGNLELRCRAHNAYEAEKYFGPACTQARGKRKLRGLPLVREERLPYGVQCATRSGPSVDFDYSR